MNIMSRDRSYHYHCSLLGFIFITSIFLICLNSCATEALWDNQKFVKEEKSSAISDQLLVSFVDREHSTNPVLYFHYNKLDGYDKNNDFFTDNEGYLKILNLDGSSSIYEGLRVLLNEPFKSKIILKN